MDRQNLNELNIEIKKLLHQYNSNNFYVAEELALKLIEKFPKEQLIWKILSMTYVQTEKPNKAINTIQKAIELNPKDFEAYNNLGIMFQDVGRLDDANDSFKKAIKLKPEFPLTYYNLGNSLKEMGKLNQAEFNYKKALNLKPNYTEAYNNLGNIYLELGKFNQASENFKKAISINPNNSVTNNNLGFVLYELGKLDEAESHCKKAISLNPNYSEAYNNLGIIFQNKGELSLAEENYKKAILFNSEYADAKFNLSILLNLKGNLLTGFKLHEWRLKKKLPTTRAPNNNLAWDGKKNLLEKKFLVYEEQGIGDIIQFFRYLHLLEKLGAQVTFKVKSELHKLLKTSNSKIKFINKFPENKEFDFESPLMSLPYYFKTDIDKIPSSKSYLRANNEKIAEWNVKLKSDCFKIGICWQGSKSSKQRSFPLSLFKKISMLPGIELISLHKGDGENQLNEIDFNVKQLDPNFDKNNNAFIDTSAVMMNCDLIITSDTVTPHLAGALGVPVWLVLKFMPHWPWMLERKDSPWYPSMKLYRQKQINNWDSVFDEMKYDLEKLLNEQRKRK